MTMTAGFVYNVKNDPQSAFYTYGSLIFYKINVGPFGIINPGYVQYPTLPAPNPTRVSPFYQW